MTDEKLAARIDQFCRTITCRDCWDTGVICKFARGGQMYYVTCECQKRWFTELATKHRNRVSKGLK